VTFEFKQFRRRKLPHIHPPGAILFVTFRLAGSIPKSVLKTWKAEKTWLELQIKRVSSELAVNKTSEILNHQARLNAFHRRWFREYEEILDKADHGPTWLRDKRVARSVADSLEYRDGKVYRLDAYCIMSNHVHVVFQPFLDERSLSLKKDAGRLAYESKDPPLDVIMHSLKSYTANEANKILSRSGPFWETESYDRVVRDSREYYRVKAYVLNNPVKAGLVKHWREWPWSWKRK
jgi:putative transposase